MKRPSARRVSGAAGWARSRASEAARQPRWREMMQWLNFWREAREGLWDDLAYWQKHDA